MASRLNTKCFKRPPHSHAKRTWGQSPGFQKVVNDLGLVHLRERKSPLVSADVRWGDCVTSQKNVCVGGYPSRRPSQAPLCLRLAPAAIISSRPVYYLNAWNRLKNLQRNWSELKFEIWNEANIYEHGISTLLLMLLLSIRRRGQ